jgi:hypothetical protein
VFFTLLFVQALWIHRRFLLWGFGHNSKIFWSSSATTVAESVVTVSFERQEESLERVMQLAAKELQFADSCIAACGPDVMEDANRQCEFAASYKLWLLSLVSSVSFEVLKSSSLVLAILLFALCPVSTKYVIFKLVNASFMDLC